MKNRIVDTLLDITKHHYQNCKLYRDYVDTVFGNGFSSLHDLPYVPVRAFKELELKSIAEQDVFKVMLSSGTTGAQSRVFLNKETAKEQTRHLSQSFRDNFGEGRFPMLIIDSENTARGFTARTAAVNGFSLFSKKRCFALDDGMHLRVKEVTEFLEKHKNETIFVFGFTFVLYQYFFQVIKNQRLQFDLSSAFVLHGGGWKKLEAIAISDTHFKTLIAETTGCQSVHNYYGMIEQTGSVYFECEHGNLHAPHNGTVLARSPDTLEVLEYDTPGLLQVFSTVQKSYPGHSLLTEDIGMVQKGSTCACGRNGDIVKIHGRLKMAEIRGCSDAV